MLLRECQTYSKQGNIGLSYAIAYYSKLGYIISIPLTDTQDYDIIADTGEALLKIQVKTTTCKSVHNIYQLNLKVSGGNRSGEGKDKTFDQNNCDLVFAMTNDFEFYSIPRKEITSKNSISLGDKWLPFKVTLT